MSEDSTCTGRKLAATDRWKDFFLRDGLAVLV
jgi:hypothetical protein